MSLSSIILMVFILLLIVFSIKERTKRILTRNKNWDALGDSKVSPVSNALANLVGTAGGIYLSVVMLITFLELDVPTKIEIMHINLEPLAATSILIAIVQPFALKILRR